MLGRYNYNHLRQAFESPNLALRELNRLYYRMRSSTDFNDSGVDIFAEDWDNLILLDACRYDLFRDESTLSGELDSRLSRGSATVEFLRGNLHGRKLHEVVYVTGNPQYYKFRNSIQASFHDTIHVWKGEGWNDEYGTVLPATMTEAALEAASQYPNKRLLIHYLQPHYPFLSDDFEPYRNGIEAAETNFWTKAMRGEQRIDPDLIWSGYRSNFKTVHTEILKLLESINGKTVVTSDHGNAIGERSFPFPIREWGHPRGIYIKELVEVPWLVISADDRRLITAEPPSQESKEVTEDIVSNRLSSLGYI